MYHHVIEYTAEFFGRGGDSTRDFYVMASERLGEDLEHHFKLNDKPTRVTSDIMTKIAVRCVW